ncbi:ATP-dependent RNA helicase DDX42 isoform X2 [Sphaerodactylus townsendi]|uniref:ATP-dependent RNA helicase DDX42 isoform X1 n=2 Tax=Sphaerodactylus townsendi TaxID=933632 RepID=UPI002026427D|nr:ATP-dependent RNA helicase DDX42 isoform X1 [Sphaerodactylus townsendi]XP_048373082.1 ATP-dependent RNA helicase DDX42 isoform X1 [Sphaerodactylus townsendi]XP_048373083.1 ATP-dependent RNA helicase DDX42 isoform X1 [Sphaerodactylus townsendi]XP_048373084.1 ATP-dependent RNA helicase DDX42 isoform X2 [Sphaerodactylus townsendi]
MADAMNWNKGGPGTKRGFGFGGFAISSGKKEEPKLPQQSHSAFGATGSAAGFGKNTPPQLPSFYKIGSKRANFDEENAYFEDEEEDSNNVDLPYIPAENSPTRQQFHSKTPDSDSEDDPLEAFMAEVEDQAARDMKRLEDKDKERKNTKGIRDDIEEEDDQEAYFRYMAENPNAGVVPEEEEDNLEYDSDGNPIAPSKKIIDPLPPIDHSEIEYPPFEKNFYEEHEEITSLTPQQVVELRHKLNLRVSGAAPPRPGSSFAHFGFDEQLMHQIRKSEYTQPTPIQCQGVPVALSGRDMIGIAKTGSGKTAAFIWPMLVHIMDQKELEPGDGPIAVIVCPTRELCQQIHAECKRFGKAYNLRSVAVYGGGSMWEQAKALQEGAEIVVCTPGRLIDHVKKKATNLQRVTYLVFDEADRMFDMGFEYQVRSVASHVRPERQTLLFSATFRKKIERLARDILIDPIRVVQGDIGEANEDITQIVEILSSGPNKWNWLTSRLVEFTSSGSVLLFVTKKANAEELANNLRQEGHSLGLLHGDMDQSERNKVISDFKKSAFPVLVATDVAARGLDIPSIKTVINYDVARDIDTHTHRIGRTGRAGEKGVAYTLLTPKDSNFAGDLVRNLEGANQNVSKELLDLAMQNAWFRKSRFKGGKGKKLNIGGGGLGYRERPGLGSDGSDRGSNSVMSNYEAYKPSTGAMGDRLSAMKAAFQSQYKSHFVAASFSNQKSGTSSAGASGWTSAGSLNSVPTNSAQNFLAKSDNPMSAPKGLPGFVSSGTLNSIPPFPGPGIQGFNSANPSNSAREGSTGSRERYSDNRGSGRHSDGQRHGDGSGRHGDGQRHGDGYRHGENRHGDSYRHSESRHSGGGSSSRHGDSRNNGDSRNSSENRNSENRNNESRKDGNSESRKDGNSESRKDGNNENRKDDNNENRKDGSSRDNSKIDGFAVPEPPKRKKSRWDS